MKKIKGVFILFILSLICLFSNTSFCATVNSASVNIIQDENAFFQKHSYARVSKEKVLGFGGFSKSDECIKLTGKDVTGHGNWYTQTSWQGDSNYLVVEFDIMLSDDTKDVFLATGGHTPITPIISADDFFKKDVWGNFVAVFDIKNNTSDLYFNNMPVTLNYHSVFNDGVANHKYIRLVVSGESGSVAYINNYKMYETDTPPHIVATPSISGYEYESVITVDINQSFDSLFTVDEDTSVTIFKDTTYTATLGTNEPFVNGCVVALENESGYRFYYIDVDDGVCVEDSISDGTIPVRKGETEIVYGLFGKLSDDASQKIISACSLPCFTSYTWLNEDYEGIIRADFNIEPGNARKIYIGTNVNMPVSDALTLLSGRWNRVSVVYDTKSFDKQSGTGIATVYVNGIKVSETRTTFEHLSQLRVVIEGDGGSFAYVDDFSLTQFSKTDAEILCPPVIADGIEVQNGIITQKGINAGSIISQNPADKVRVYKDAFYEEILGETEMPEFGNMVVIESRDNVYAYYPVFGNVSTNEVINIFQNVNAFKFNGGTTTGVTALGGKDETDISFKVQVASNNYCNFNYKWENSAFDGFVVTEMNIIPGTASVFLWNSDYSPYAPEIKGLNQNQWNKVTAVYNTKPDETGKYSVDLYVNGVFSSTYKTKSKSGDELMIFVSGDVGAFVYIDDFKVYETDFMPFITTPDISNFYYTYENNVVFDENVTPDGLKISGYTAKVFTDATLTKTIGEKAVIPVGAILVVYDKYNNFRYYTVSEMFLKNILVQSKNADKTGFSFSDVKYETASGVHGREADDLTFKITINSSSANNGYFNYNYTNMNSDRYFVFESSVYSESDCTVRIGTRYHNPISADITTQSGKYKKNQWNKVVYIFDKINNTGYLYINGELCSTKADISNFTVTETAFRFVIYAPNGTVHYMDDIIVYESAVKPNPAKAGVIEPGMNYLINLSTLYMPQDIDMSDLKPVFGIDDNIDVKLIKDGNVIDFSKGGKFPDKSTVVLDKGNSVITAYDISVVADNNAVMFGTATEEGVLKDGVLTVGVPLEKTSGTNAKVGIAKYKDGKLLSIETAQGSTAARFVKCDIEIDADTVDTVKVFVWNNKFIPLSKNGISANK